MSNSHIPILLIYFCILFSYSQIIPPSKCPATSRGYLESSMITLGNSLAGESTIPNSQSSVYNYPLKNAFLNEPDVVIGLNGFQSIGSPYLMISIKPLPSSSPTSLSFLLRFYYKYTSWKLISFYFLAEDRIDIDANYYEIDTRQLATSNTSKAIQIELPFNNNFVNMQALFFLSGFQIGTLQDISNILSFSPFEIQLIPLSIKSQGASMIISATTQTEVYSLLISYIAIDNSSTSFFNGNYQYSSLTSAAYLSIPLNIQSTPLILFGGINGFIMPNIQGDTQFSSNFRNNSLQILFNPAANYVTFDYLIIYTPEHNCFYCQNSPYQYQDNCVPVCPANTELINYFCISCSQSQLWNGSNCVNRCFGGQVWNQTLLNCRCPINSNWNGASCVFCPFGQLWLPSSLSCGCSIGQYFNSYTCVAIPSCPGNQIFDTISFMCACQSNSNWNGTSCLTCPSGYIWNYQTNNCVCNNGSIFNGYQCVTCFGGMLFDIINYNCQCPTNTAWNGTDCVNTCKSPFVLTNGLCQCPPGTLINASTCSPTPVCPTGTTWISNGCQNITCSPGYFWNGSTCIQFSPNCPLNCYWNGIVCVSFNIQCPTGSFWNGSYCLPSASNCSSGSYYSNGTCISFPQLCLPKYVWNGSACLLVGILQCPSGQYFDGNRCVNITCTNGQIWNSSLSQCICPLNTFWNKQQCIQCPFGQFYGRNGCACLDGYFLVDGVCYNLQQIYCSMVSYAQWNGQNCICNPGFDAVGLNCVCNGLIVGNNCNRCYNIPNSAWVNGSCSCINGYYSSMGQCLPYQNTTNPSTSLSCNAGTLLDAANNVCVTCPNGCLSCLTQAICLQCRPQFNYNWATYQCNQICGDAKRFSLSCDDGNNLDGDGCSSDCKVESGFTCYGGSPNSADFCTKFLPSQIVLNLTGTTHLFGKIVVNVRSNYLPSNLTDPSLPCSDICKQILQVNLSGFNSYKSIETQYLVGSAGFSFSITIDFGQEPIGLFTISVGINPAIGQAYFPRINFAQTFSFAVNPALLSLADTGQEGRLS